MKRFAIKIIVFGIIIVGVLLFCDSRNIRKKDDINGPEVYQAIQKSKKYTKKYKYLLLGDSTGEQLYSNRSENENYYSLTCNQAITLAGQYCLLMNYINHNRENLPDTIILLYHPLSFSNNLDRFSFHYFLKPFLTDEYRPYFTDELLELIHQKIPLWWLCQLPFIKNSNWSCDWNESSESNSLFSEISYSYLKMMSGKLDSLNISFKIYSPPVDCLKKEVIEKKFSMTNDIKCISQVAFCDYVNSISYYPDSIFLDSIHVKKEHIPNDYLNIVSVQ